MLLEQLEVRIALSFHLRRALTATPPPLRVELTGVCNTRVTVSYSILSEKMYAKKAFDAAEACEIHVKEIIGRVLDNGGSISATIDHYTGKFDRVMYLT